MNESRLKKRTAVVVDIDHSTNIVTVFLSGSKPSAFGHRSVPLDDSPHYPYQPKQPLISHPVGSFNGSQGYISFTYAIKAKVVYVQPSHTGNSQKIGVSMHKPPPGELSFPERIWRPIGDPLSIIKTFLNYENCEYLVSLNKCYHAGVRYTADRQRIDTDTLIPRDGLDSYGDGDGGGGGAGGLTRLIDDFGDGIFFGPPPPL